MSATALLARQPTENKDIFLLQEECRNRGLIAWSTNITLRDIIEANPLKPGNEEAQSLEDLST
jgi:hypothetical protein